MELEKGSMVTCRPAYPIIRVVADVTAYILQVNTTIQKSLNFFSEAPQLLLSLGV